MKRRPLTTLLKGMTAGILAFALSAPVAAKIDLVTLPARDKTELTIYNSQDLTLVREVRTLSFNKGMNEIQFSWANTLIDPTSLQIDLKGAPGLDVQDAVYPANSSQLIVWNIEAGEETSAEVEISYFTSGLSWSASYIVKANADQTKLGIREFTKVTNNSGEDFENANTRVVVGEVNLIEAIRELAQRGINVDRKKMIRGMARADEELDKGHDLFFGAAMSAPMAAVALKEAKEIVRQAVSEYHVLAVEGTEDIENGWGKEFPHKPIADVDFDLSYEIDPRKFGNQVVKIYKFKNTEDHNLGKDPLPDGQYYVYTDDANGGLRYEGTTTMKYVPVGEEIEMNLGTDGMLRFEQRVMSTKRENFEKDYSGNIIGWDEVRSVELELKNSRDRAVPVKLTHYIDGDWEFKSIDHPDYKKIARDTVRWELPVDALSKTIIKYDVIIHQGSRAKNN